MKSSLKILRLASFNSLTVLAPQIVGLVLVVSIGEQFGDTSRAAAGLATTLFGIAVVVSASGSTIVLRNASLEVRKFGNVRAAGDEIADCLRVEFGMGRRLSIASIAFAAFAAVLVQALIPDVAPLVTAYLLGAIPWLLAVPHLSSVAGAFQATGRDKEHAALVSFAAILQSATVILATKISDSAELALFLTALINGIVAVALLLVRVHALNFILQPADKLRFLAWRHPWGGSRGGLGDRIAVAADGLVYMSIFFLATLVAANYSTEAGASVAFGVAVLRTLIVPLKQVGMVGARVTVQSRSTRTTDGMRSTLLAGGLGCILAIPVAYGLAEGFALSSSAFVWLLIAQLAVEPFASVLLAALKVLDGPRAGTLLLIACYWALAPLGLALLWVFDSASDWAVWSLLLLVRTILAVGTVVLAVTFLRRERMPQPPERSVR